MPKKVDVDTERRRISNATVAVVGAAGIEGARLRDVARAAGVTTGAVMHYFDDKEAVLESALGEVVRRTLQKMKKPMAGKRAGDAELLVKSACRYLPVDAASRNEWRVWLAFWGRASVDERLRRVHQRYYQQIVDGLTAWLRTLAKPTRRLSPKQLRRAADAVVAAIDGVGTRATLEPRQWPASRQYETLRILILPMLTEFGRDHATDQQDDQ